MAITFEQTNQMIKLSEGIKLKDTDTPNTYIIINTKFVKPYLKSPVLLEAYVTVLNEKEELSIKKDIHQLHQIYIYFYLMAFLLNK